jgi:hypothetical protein
MQRIKTSDRNFLFVSGDVELNPGPVNTSNMSVLTTRLARIGRKPVNIVGDGNAITVYFVAICFTEQKVACPNKSSCNPTFNKLPRTFHRV